MLKEEAQSYRAKPVRFTGEDLIDSGADSSHGHAVLGQSPHRYKSVPLIIIRDRLKRVLRVLGFKIR